MWLFLSRVLPCIRADFASFNSMFCLIIKGIDQEVKIWEEPQSLNHSPGACRCIFSPLAVWMLIEEAFQFFLTLFCAWSGAERDRALVGIMIDKSSSIFDALPDILEMSETKSHRIWQNSEKKTYLAFNIIWHVMLKLSIHFISCIFQRIAVIGNQREMHQTISQGSAVT